MNILEKKKEKIFHHRCMKHEMKEKNQLILCLFPSPWNRDNYSKSLQFNYCFRMWMASLRNSFFFYHTFSFRDRCLRSWFSNVLNWNFSWIHFVYNSFRYGDNNGGMSGVVQITLATWCVTFIDFAIIYTVASLISCFPLPKILCLWKCQEIST